MNTLGRSEETGLTASSSGMVEETGSPEGKGRRGIKVAGDPLSMAK